MRNINKYCELSKEEYKRKIKEYVKKNQVDFNDVYKYISSYPKIVYKNIFEGVYEWAGFQNIKMNGRK